MNHADDATYDKMLDTAQREPPTLDRCDRSRPAVQGGRRVNRIFGDLANQLRERHEASDFDTKTQNQPVAVT